MTNRAIGLIAAAVVIIASVFLFTNPIPQDPAYHNFVDARTLFGVSNFWNVASNFPFLVVGLAGLIYVYRYADDVCAAGPGSAYLVFFIGILLTAFGSSYYHLEPGNDTLVWDRLPMTIGFAGLLTIIVAEFVSARAARSMLVPLLLIGFASVEYWAWTEANGAGDLRPYAIVQFLPMLMIPVILLSYRPVFGDVSCFWWMMAFYFIAKLLEFFDASVFSIGGLISGHSLKHVAAALTPTVFLYALWSRRQRPRPDS